MEEQDVQVTVKLELQDYMNFAKLSNEKWLYGFYGFALSEIIGNVILKNITGVFFAAALLIGYEIYRRQNLKTQFATNELVHNEMIFDFTVNGIKISTTDGSRNSNIKWDKLYGVKQSKDIMLFLAERSSGHIIPKRLLNAEQIADLEGFIKNRLDSTVLEKANYLKYACIGVIINVLTFIYLRQVTL